VASSRSPLSPWLSLQLVLTAAAKARGNQARFKQAGLVDATGELSEDWQANFAKLKPLRKAELRAQPGAFLTDASDIIYRGKTSGTQGEAFTYFAGQAWNQARIAARQRSLGWWGIDPETSMLNLASRLSPVRLHDSSLVGGIDDEFLDILLSQLQTQPLLLRGYPSRLCEVAIALKHQLNLQDRPLSSVRKIQPIVAVIATGECLYGQQQALLERIIDAPVINEYGSQECGMSGLSCPEAGRLHLDGDRCLYEIVDGELLTTDLYNCVMPMVRYSGGDALKLSTDPCPCGRAGPTAVLLGRQEEAFVIKGQQRWPGEFDLPSFPNILAYQVQLSPTHRQLWVQPSELPAAFSSKQGEDSSTLEPLRAWLSQTFGEQNTEILIEPPRETSTAHTLETVDSDTWLGQVAQQAWSSWLNNPLPLGDAAPVAALLRNLVMPRQIVLQQLPARTLALTEQLMRSGESQNLKVEVMKLRVLLWATGLQAGMAEPDGFAAQHQYETLLERFQRVVKQLKREPNAELLAHSSALGFDLLAPLLTLKRDVCYRLWQPIQQHLHQAWPEGLKADRFTLHHYLAILDQAGWTAQQQPHPWQAPLRPFSAMFQGDLIQFSGQLNPSTIALWAEMVHNSPGAFGSPSDSPSDPSTFQAAWQRYRRALLQQNPIAMGTALNQCFEQAEDPSQIAQCWLEKAYGDLVLGKSIEAGEWLSILRKQAGLLQPDSGATAIPAKTNPLPWLPLLKALAPQLLEAGDPDLAYACLFAAAPPNRHQSTFDHQAQAINSKQSILSWREQL